MFCPICSGPTKVTETRRKPPDGSYRRRRECYDCKLRFTTREYIVKADVEERPDGSVIRTRPEPDPAVPAPRISHQAFHEWVEQELQLKQIDRHTLAMELGVSVRHLYRLEHGGVGSRIEGIGVWEVEKMLWRYDNIQIGSVFPEHLWYYPNKRSKT